MSWKSDNLENQILYSWWQMIAASKAGEPDRAREFKQIWEKLRARKKAAALSRKKRAA